MKRSTKTFFVVSLASYVFLFLPLSHVSAAGKEISRVCGDSELTLVSPDKSWSVCRIRTSDGKVSMVIQGKYGESYDWMGFPDFSPDNKRLAYKARNGNEWFVVTGYANGSQKRGKSYSEIESVIWNLDHPAIKFFVFGPSSTLAYSARQGDKWFIITENSESPAYDWSRPILFSPDGSKMGYKARVGDKWFVVVNGKAGQGYDWVNIPIFSQDNKQFAYKAKKGNFWFIVANGVEGKQYDDVGFPNFNANSTEIVYKAKQGSSWFVVVNGNKGKSYDSIVSLSPNNDYRDFALLTFASSSPNVEYGAQKGNRWYVVSGNTEVSEYHPSEESQPETFPLELGKPTTIDGTLDEFTNTDGLLRSTASRTENRLDKLAEKRGFEDQSLWTELADVRLSIHMSEDKVLEARNSYAKSPNDTGTIKSILATAKQYTIIAQQKLIALIQHVKEK